DRREDRPVQDLPAGRALPARPLPLQVHGVLRRALLVGLPDPVQPRRSQGRGRLYRQGPPPPLRRPAGRRYAAALIRPTSVEYRTPHGRPTAPVAAGRFAFHRARTPVKIG